MYLSSPPTSRPPKHLDTLRRLTDAIVRRAVDAVAFTSAATTGYLLEQARLDNVLDTVVNALVNEIQLFCIGTLTAGPLRAHGLAPTVPPAPAIAELAAVIQAGLLGVRYTVAAGEMPLEIRSQAVIVDGHLIPIQYGPLAVLRALVRSPGVILAAADIRAVVPGWSDVDDHAIEMAVSRLRRTLDNPALRGVQPVQTVMKRGYVWVG
jgi:uroporphyrinogen-III synthase